MTRSERRVCVSLVRMEKRKISRSQAVLNIFCVLKLENGKLIKGTGPGGSLPSESVFP